MSDYSEGPWTARNMVNADGSPMTPEDIGEYVSNSVKLGRKDQFLFVTNSDGRDICHVGNGPKSPYNAELIAAAPDMAAEIAELKAQLAALQQVAGCAREVKKNFWAETDKLAAVEVQSVNALSAALEALDKTP